MAFEIYTAPEVIKQEETVPKAKVTENGTITLNRPATALTTGNFARLAYDSEEGLVGIKFLEVKEEGTVRVTRTKAETIRIYASDFLAHFGLDSEKARTGIKVEDTGEGWLTLPLKAVA